MRDTFILNNKSVNNIYSANKEMLERIFAGCKEALKNEGIDLDERKRNRSSHTLEKESIPGDGTFIIQGWNHNEHHPATRGKRFEVARNKVLN